MDDENTRICTKLGPAVSNGLRILIDANYTGGVIKMIEQNASVPPASHGPVHVQAVPPGDEKLNNLGSENGSMKGVIRVRFIHFCPITRDATCS